MKLVRYENARQALIEAKRVDEVKDIRDKAAAMSAYARQAKDTDLIAWATEIKVRAERKCGEMLKETAKHGERATRGSKNQHSAKSHDTTLQLADIGISRDQSSRFQKLAAMPEEHFETAVETAKAQAGEVTTAYMLRSANEVRRQEVMREMERPLTAEEEARIEEMQRKTQEKLAELGELKRKQRELKRIEAEGGILGVSADHPEVKAIRTHVRVLTLLQEVIHHIEHAEEEVPQTVLPEIEAALGRIVLYYQSREKEH